MEFYSAYAQGFARVAACTIPVALADPAANAETVLAQARECHAEGVAVAVFPELCLSGYSIDDLLLQDTLLTAVQDAIATLVAGSADLLPVIVVGAPLMHGTRVLNCAVVIKGGRILGVAPKSYLPNYREFYERRHFAPGDDLRGTTIRVAGDEVPLGPDLIFAATDLPDLRLHVEICEDMWVPVPPSAEAALAGATVLVQPLRQPDHDRPRGGPAAAGPQRQLPEQRGLRLRRRRPGRVDDRPVVGRPDDDLRVRRPAR